MRDYRGEVLVVGDLVAIYFGYNSLETGRVHKISPSGNKAKVEVERGYHGPVISKWKDSGCMVKLGVPLEL